MTETIVLGGGCFWCTQSLSKLFYLKINKIAFGKKFFAKFMANLWSIQSPTTGAVLHLSNGLHRCCPLS